MGDQFNLVSGAHACLGGTMAMDEATLREHFQVLDPGHTGRIGAKELFDIISPAKDSTGKIIGDGQDPRYKMYKNEKYKKEICTDEEIKNLQAEMDLLDENGKFKEGADFDYEKFLEIRRILIG